MSIKQKSELHIVMADLHYPVHSKKAVDAVFDFIEQNRAQIKSVTLLGDALDCQNISRHTVGKPGLRKSGGYKKDIDGFAKTILDRIDQLVPQAKRTYVCGNHEDWLESDMLDAMPEMKGTIDIPVMLNLKARGWTWVPVGGHIKIGKVVLIHGDQIGSGALVAKKMVDLIAGRAVMGHCHTAGSFTRSSTIDDKRKWIGHTLGCLCTQSPNYAKGRPNAFVWGFGCIETFGSKSYANIHSIIIMPDGTFGFGGRVFGGGR